MAKYSEILLDTNFLIEAEKRRILDDAKNLVSGAKLVTLEAVVEELEQENRKLALELLKTEGVEIKPGKGYADKQIEEYANKGFVVVATNDKKLTEKLRLKSIPVIYPTKTGCDIAGGII